MTLGRLRRRVDARLASLGAVARHVGGERAALRSLRARRRALEGATLVAQEVAERVQGVALARVERIATRCLRAVFDDPYRLRVVPERRRGRTEVVLLFRRGKLEVDPLTAAGLGVVDVAAFALRVAALLMERPRRRPFLALDEPFRFVEARLRPRVRRLLETLSVELGLQVLMITHDRALRAGRLLELARDGSLREVDAKLG